MDLGIKTDLQESVFMLQLKDFMPGKFFEKKKNIPAAAKGMRFSLGKV